MWTPEQTGTYLDRAALHRLHAPYHLIAFRGLRRPLSSCCCPAMEAGLPPGLLRDLRHGAATILLRDGRDLKVEQETLGLSSISIASGTYTRVLPDLALQSAEDAAAVILNARARPEAHETAVASSTFRGPRTDDQPRMTTGPLAFAVRYPQPAGLRVGADDHCL